VQDPLHGLSITIHTYQHFYQVYTFIVEALEMIGHRQYIEEHGDLYTDWDTASRSEAQQILASISTSVWYNCPVINRNIGHH